MELDEVLTCSICLELFTEPLILKCSHNLCTNCLEQLGKGKDLLLYINTRKKEY